MAAVLVLLSVLLGSAVPSIAAISVAQWAIIGVNAAKAGPQVVQFIGALQKELNSPQFEAWAAANGDLAIRLRPGEITER